MTASRTRTNRPTAQPTPAQEVRSARRAMRERKRQWFGELAAAEWVEAGAVPGPSVFVADDNLFCPSCASGTCQHVELIRSVRAGHAVAATVTVTPLVRGTRPGVLAEDVITNNGAFVRPWLGRTTTPTPDPGRAPMVISGGRASTLLAMAEHALSGQPVDYAVEVGIHGSCDFGCKTYAIKRADGLRFQVWHSGAYGCPDSRVAERCCESVLVDARTVLA